jgi:hypothetical protein
MRPGWRKELSLKKGKDLEIVNRSDVLRHYTEGYWSSRERRISVSVTWQPSLLSGSAGLALLRKMLSASEE